MDHRQITWVVIAAYNEAAMIGHVVSSVLVDGWKVAVVDDGSPDDTAANAAAAGAVVLRHVVNLGQGAALQTGIEFALGRGAERIVTFDADGQHRVEDLPAMVAALDDADVALGSRHLGGTEGAGSGRRLFLRAATANKRTVQTMKKTLTTCGVSSGILPDTSLIISGLTAYSADAHRPAASPDAPNSSAASRKISRMTIVSRATAGARKAHSRSPNVAMPADISQSGSGGLWSQTRARVHSRSSAGRTFSS